MGDMGATRKEGGSPGTCLQSPGLQAHASHERATVARIFLRIKLNAPIHMKRLEEDLQ